MGLFSALLSQFEDSVIDFYGQLHVTIVMTVIIAAFTTVGFIVGYFKESFALTVKFLLVGAAVSALACSPPWPFYGRHRIKWKKRATE